MLRWASAGAYRRVCISLRVHHLAVNALVAAATMSEMEGGNLNDDPGEHVEGAAAALPAFRVLRAMVMSWLNEANERQNVFADTLLMQLYRWCACALVCLLVSLCMGLSLKSARCVTDPLFKQKVK